MADGLRGTAVESVDDPVGSVHGGLVCAAATSTCLVFDLPTP